ncbi:MAG TPA: hypothetical protein DCR93_01730 [Cytophagales bacterium]|nr:hypothetical protein [Cytophagales bacterium]HAP58272.1 hypothetical protein [Cytophagales bacterium]
MTVVELKAHVISLVEQLDDPEKLREIEALLTKSYVSPSWEKEELQRSVARSEADIKAGRVYTMPEVETQMEKYWEDRT